VTIGGVSRRIITVTNQLNFVVAAPGFTNGAGQNATISEQVLTKDLYNNVGDAVQKTRVVDNTAILVDSFILDYDDSLTSGDVDFDDGTPNVVCLATTTNIDDIAARVTLTRPSTSRGWFHQRAVDGNPSSEARFVLPPECHDRRRHREPSRLPVLFHQRQLRLQRR
jgi:hypothetical protein